MDQIATTSRSPLSSLSLDQTRQYGQKPTMNQVGKAFETLFMQTMMKSMRDAQVEGGLLDSEHEKPFQSMLDGIYSEMSVKKTNLGLAEAINRQFAPKTGPKAAAGVQAQQATLTAAQLAALSTGMQTGNGADGIAGKNIYPTNDLAASLTAQQGMSFKTSRQPSLPMGNPAQKIAPKFMTGD